MTVRYCPRCKTDVEDTGGFCLLGHRLALEPPVASIQDLRDEVDRAFEEARLEVASVMTRDDVPTAPMAAVAPAPASPVVPAVSTTPLDTPPTRRVPPPPPPPRRKAPSPEAPRVSPADVGAGVAPRPVTVPPPPATPTARPEPAPGPAVAQPADASQPASVLDDVPTAEEIHSRNASVWKDLDREIDVVGDPIGAFAPPPHMDWGPERGKGLKRKPARRSRHTEASE